MADQAAIHAAMFKRLRDDVSGVKFFTRDWIEPSALASVNRVPALEYSVEGDSDSGEPFLPPVLTMTAELDVYFVHKTASDATEAALDVVAQIRAACLRHPGEDSDYYTTLGGLVDWARVRRVRIIEGHVTGIAMAEVILELHAAEAEGL